MYSTEREGQRGVGLVVHRQEDAGDDLDHQHQQRQRAEEVPEVEVLRRVVLRHVLLVELGRPGSGCRPSSVSFSAGAGVGGSFLEFSHVVLCCACVRPSCLRRSADGVSDRYMCGGTSRLSGAGLFLNTRPAMSKVEPWQGHRKPPCQSSGSEGCGAGLELVGRRAAQVGADAHGDQEFGLDRAAFVARVLGRQFGGLALGVRVGQLRVDLLQRGQLLRACAHDPHRLAAPFDRHLLARLQRADVDLDRRRRPPWRARTAGRC